MQSSQIPAKFPLVWGANANPTYIRTIPTGSQIGIQNGAASFNDGYPPNCFQAGGYPFGQDFNGITKLQTAWEQWQQAGGPIFYDASFSTSIGGYAKWAVLRSSVTVGLFFISTAENNTTNPDAGGANWISFSWLANSIHIGTDSGTPGSIVANVTPQITSYADASVYYITIASGNTCPGTTVANFNGVGAKSCVHGDGTPLLTNDYMALYDAGFIYNSAKDIFQLITPVTNQQVLLLQNVTYFVNNSTGSDTNDGLTTGTAWSTVTHALAVIGKYNANGFTITINVAFTGTNYGSIVLPPIGGNGFINITATGGSSIFTNPSGAAVAGPGVTGYTLTGFTYTSAGVDGTTGRFGGVVAGGSGSIKLVNSIFGACNGACVWATNAAAIALKGTLAFSGNVAATGGAPGGLMFANNNGIIQSDPTSPTVTITSAISGNYFARADSLGVINFIYTSLTNSGNFTGQKYGVTLNSVINTFNGNGGGSTGYYPGISFIANTGGVYA